MTVRVQREDFDVGAELERLAAGNHQVGAVVSFVGLVRDLAGDAPPIEVRAAIQPAANQSGYQWSSAAGAPVTLSSGTLCRAEIVVERQRPISLVIPIVRKSLGVD